MKGISPLMQIAIVFLFFFIGFIELVQANSQIFNKSVSINDDSNCQKLVDKCKSLEDFKEFAKKYANECPELAAKIKQIEIDHYKETYDLAYNSTSENCDVFILLYKNDDKDKLVPKIEKRRKELYKIEYEKEFNAAESSEQYLNWIKKFPQQGYDPKKLVVEAKRNQKLALKREAELQREVENQTNEYICDYCKEVVSSTEEPARSECSSSPHFRKHVWTFLAPSGKIRYKCNHCNVSVNTASDPYRGLCLAKAAPFKKHTWSRLN